MTLELLLEETEHAGTKEEWVASTEPFVQLVGRGGLVVVMIAEPQFAPKSGPIWLAGHAAP